MRQTAGSINPTTYSSQCSNTKSLQYNNHYPSAFDCTVLYRGHGDLCPTACTPVSLSVELAWCLETAKGIGLEEFLLCRSQGWKISFSKISKRRYHIFDIFQKMKISNKLYNNRCNTLMQYLMTISLVTSHLYHTLKLSF